MKSHTFMTRNHDQVREGLLLLLNHAMSLDNTEPRRVDRASKALAELRAWYEGEDIAMKHIAHSAIDKIAYATDEVSAETGPEDPPTGELARNPIDPQADLDALETALQAALDLAASHQIEAAPERIHNPLAVIAIGQVIVGRLFDCMAVLTQLKALAADPDNDDAYDALARELNSGDLTREIAYTALKNVRTYLAFHGAMSDDLPN